MLAFCKLSLQKLLSGCEQYWVPFFASLGADIELVNLQVALEFPQKVGKVFPMQVAEETCIIGCTQEAVLAVVRQVVQEAQNKEIDVIFEYLCRRFCASISKSWSEQESLACNYLSMDKASRVEVVGVVEVDVLISGQEHKFCLGLGPATTKSIDEAWKAYFADIPYTGSGRFPEREELALSAEIGELRFENLEFGSREGHCA